MNISEIRLYAITDSSYTQLPLEEQVEAAIIGGADMIQLREKNITDEEYAEKAKKLLAITRKLGVPLIINDSVKVAAMSGADGVHLGQSDGSPAEARKVLGKHAIIGVTAKSTVQADMAQREGADYIGSGAMFVSPTKPAASAMTVETLTDICRVTEIPVFAIGGITAENCMTLKGTGISGIAAVSSVFGGKTPEDITYNAAMMKAAAEETVGGEEN